MRRVLLAVTLLALSAVLAFAQFYSGMPTEERQRLAEDYYLAGGQYTAAGDPEKGQSFQELAFVMYPGLDPKAIRETEHPSAAELLAKSNIPVAGPPEADTTPGLIRSRLLRLIGSVLTESADATVQNLDGSVYFTDARFELSRAEMHRQLLALFAQTSLHGIQPSALYDLASLSVSPASAEVSAMGWGPVYVADINARMDLSKVLPIWSTRQRFFLRDSGGSWLVFAMGNAAPPRGWKPAAMSVPVAAQTAPSAGQERSTIEAAFMDCVARFLQKDSDGALRYFAPRVRLERLGATVAREELGKAFKSYFESMSFGGLKTEELIEPQSVFVVESDRFGDLASGRRYVLTVKTRLDLAEAIPFWTKFQEYYFTAVDGSWRIFAIF
jgi:hypothetical protein